MASISVIIPVYNHAHTLESCLGSLAGQAREQPLQVIIVNDGSTDAFKETLARLLEKYADLRTLLNPKIVNQENKGAPAARNRGLREATGEYVIFLDADTFCYPGMLETMCLALEAHPRASYAYSRFRFGWKKMKSQEFNPDDLRRYNYIDTTSLIRRADCPLWDESLERFQDWDLWLTLLEQGKRGAFVPKVLYKKIVRGRKGYSSWLPGFMFHLPWKAKAVKAYEEARKIILKKHHLAG